jgi:UDP-glucose 4-epimerase
LWAVLKVRVLVSGMGGELGSRVATMLETQAWVSAIAGLDLDPPRRRLRSADFHRIEPRDRRRTEALVAEFDPHVVLHLGVYEPHARANPGHAASLTHNASLHVLGSAVRAPSLQLLVVRSGIEVYGRRRGAPTRPDERAELAPTSPWGRSLAEMEDLACRAGNAAGVPVTRLRLAPVVGPHVPSPLGRYLRLPLVPVSLLADPAFSVLHMEDAARALVAAAERRHDGPVNVVAPGAVTATQAARLGGNLPLPLVGFEWPLTRLITAAAGAPVPDHVLELVHRGRTADGSRALELIGFEPALTTPEVVRNLHDWATVTHLRPQRAVA